ncbi:MAG: hypothetical protein ABI612_20515 [Betaproteobacteria bacterium]
MYKFFSAPSSDLNKSVIFGAAAAVIDINGISAALPLAAKS